MGTPSSLRLGGMTCRSAAALVLAAITAAGSAAPAMAQGKYRIPLRMFWIARQSGWQQIACARLWSSRELQIYARPIDRFSRRDTSTLAHTYLSKILPTDLRLFGATPGLGPVTILLAPLDGETLGYFNPADLGHAGAPVSRGANRGNILYIRLPRTMPDATRTADLNEVIAHELQHLINYRQRVLHDRLRPQEDWLNEGFSFYAQIANGYWTRRDQIKVQQAMHAPNWPVNVLNEDASFLRKHGRLAYGRAGMFVTYLAAQYGPQFLQNLTNEPQTGLAGIDSVLRRTVPGMDLPSAFLDWSVAQWLHGRGVYGYRKAALPLFPHPDTAVPPNFKYPYSSDLHDGQRLALKPWGQEYLQFIATRAGDLTAHLTGPPGELRVAAILEDSTHTVGSRVVWLRPDKRGGVVLKLTGFGEFYDRLTLAINEVASPNAALESKPDPIRVRVDLQHLGQFHQV